MTASFSDTISTPIVSNAVLPGVQNGVVYCGFSLRETAGAAAVVRVRDGSASGTIIDTLAFSANQCISDHYSPNGLFCNGKIYIELVSGTIPEGSIRWR